MIFKSFLFLFSLSLVLPLGFCLFNESLPESSLWDELSFECGIFEDDEYNGSLFDKALYTYCLLVFEP